ncbi:HNH endonuclease family protein [Spongiactinospora sp. 9N601]|uniref:HNH endonuclease family protein n=1 Tax=Spongiactinospora sp. 9N601 TaxID=3375149 RepID=UPI0037B100F0
MKHSRALAATASAITFVLLGALPAAASPPPPPPVTAALTNLEALPIAPPGSSAGYDRELFPHWTTVSGTCDTRETVLRRDGDQVTTDAACRAVSGSWFSPYDGITWTRASDIDIDHMVPLSEAWKSGASQWTTERRRAFANDLASSQLWAVTDNVNQAKGDKDPALWRPPLASFQCTYARSWVDVKFRWGLAVDDAEKTALAEMLATC